MAGNQECNVSPNSTAPSAAGLSLRQFSAQEALSGVTQLDEDSKSLKESFKKDSEVIQKSMDTKDHGCIDEYKKAVEELKSFDYDKYVADTVRAHKDVAKLLN